jgi:hypothetical protein
MYLRPKLSSSGCKSPVCHFLPLKVSADTIGVLPSGDLSLSNALPTAMTRKTTKKDKYDDDSDEERWSGKTGARTGKMGIRNGFRTTRYDADDDE